jgi:hypothetical protein
MSGHWLHYLWLAYLSKPKGDRALFRLIKKHPIQSLVELGVGDASRAERIIDFARQFVPNGEFSYTGIDLFEGRPAPQHGISLKEAHGRLKRLDAKVKLIPGDPFSALARSANGLTGTDMVLISRDTDEESLERAWFYLPRMLHEKSLILTEEVVAKDESGAPSEWAFQLMDPEEILERAGTKAQHIARAA